MNLTQIWLLNKNGQSNKSRFQVSIFNIGKCLTQAVMLWNFILGNAVTVEEPGRSFDRNCRRQRGNNNNNKNNNNNNDNALGNVVTVEEPGRSFETMRQK